MTNYKELLSRECEACFGHGELSDGIDHEDCHICTGTGKIYPTEEELIREAIKHLDAVWDAKDSATEVYSLLEHMKEGGSQIYKMMTVWNSKEHHLASAFICLVSISDDREPADYYEIKIEDILFSILAGHYSIAGGKLRSYCQQNNIDLHAHIKALEEYLGV